MGSYTLCTELTLRSIIFVLCASSTTFNSFVFFSFRQTNSRVELGSGKNLTHLNGWDNYGWHIIND